MDSDLAIDNLPSPRLEGTGLVAEGAPLGLPNVLEPPLKMADPCLEGGLGRAIKELLIFSRCTLDGLAEADCCCFGGRAGWEFVGSPPKISRTSLLVALAADMSRVLALLSAVLPLLGGVDITEELRPKVGAATEAFAGVLEVCASAAVLDSGVVGAGPSMGSMGCRVRPSRSWLGFLLT